MKPIDVATRETAAFLASQLPAGAELIEVGAGLGHVAEELVDHGYRVSAIDANAEVAAAAARRGFLVRVAAWPQFDHAPVDAVAFTRSLHHIGNLDAALDRARDLLDPSGALLVEDFAYDQVSTGALDWFVGLIRSPAARALIVPGDGELVTDLLDGGDPMTVWDARHERDVHGAAAMAAAARARFGHVEVRSAPYFYRYLIRALPETAEAGAFVEEVLRQEQSLGAGSWIGRRIVARRPGAGLAHVAAGLTGKDGLA